MDQFVVVALSVGQELQQYADPYWSFKKNSSYPLCIKDFILSLHFFLQSSIAIFGHLKD